MTELLLYRDPSRTHGTPQIPQCRQAVAALTEATGWTADPRHAPSTGILVGLGLQEGFDRAGRQHEPHEVTERLDAGTIGRTWGWVTGPRRVRRRELG